MQEVVLFNSTPTPDNQVIVPLFCFVHFEDEAAQKKALKETHHYMGHCKLHVERRKEQIKPVGGTIPKTVRKFSPVKIESDLKITLNNFDWRHTAAKYFYRAVTMEDYLTSYIAALAAYRGITEERVPELEKLLIKLSAVIPRDRNLIMPPSISGLVCNQARPRSNGEVLFDVTAFLRGSPDKFILTGNGDEASVTYLNQETKSEALSTLHSLLVEGLFIYFFAKFCHHPIFKIKYSYYQRSEPIRTSLLLVTEETNVERAIMSYFRALCGAFKYNETNHELSLNNDYYSRNKQDDLKRFLDKSVSERHTKLETLTGNAGNGGGGDAGESISPEPKSDSGCHEMESLNTEDGFFEGNTINWNEASFYDDDTFAESALQTVNDILKPTEEIRDRELSKHIPGHFDNLIVKSVLEDVLFEEDDEDTDFLSNPFAVDKFLNEMGKSDTGLLAISRERFKEVVEVRIACFKKFLVFQVL